MILKTYGKHLPGQIKFTKIDDQNRGDHSYLTTDDECYFLFEYTSGQGYGFSKTNSLISNLKKKPSTKGTPQYKYKNQAISECASGFGAAINGAWLDGATLVPVPPSKIKSDPEYDVRIMQVCKQIPGAKDVRELVVLRKSHEPFHEGHRMKVEELRALLQINEHATTPAPKRIAIVDDVLTNGTHFKAVKALLQQRFPGVPTVGFFVARRVFANPFEGL